MAYVMVIVDGREFVSKGDDSATIEQAVEALYSVADDVTRLKLPLADGRFVVLPRDAVRRATFLVCPGEPPSN